MKKSECKELHELLSKRFCISNYTQQYAENGDIPASDGDIAFFLIEKLMIDSFYYALDMSNRNYVVSSKGISQKGCTLFDAVIACAEKM